MAFKDKILEGSQLSQQGILPFRSVPDFFCVTFLQSHNNLQMAYLT